VKPKYYTLTATAEEDLRTAKSWSLRRWGKALTKKYFSDIHEGAQYIAKNHGTFRSREDLTGDLDLSVYAVREHYLVYVPVSKNHIVIVAVVRQGRDLPAILAKGSFQIKQSLNEIQDKIDKGEITVGKR